MEDMGAMGDQVTSRRTATPPWLLKVSALAALGEAILLLLGLLPLLTPTAFPDNWLITIFKLHAGFSGAHLGLLMSLNLLDVAVLALEGLAILGLAAALWRTSRLWSIVAAIQPFLGIALFLLTQNAGRSAAMGAALVISLVMLRSSLFPRATAYMGIAASVLLLVGDFSAGVIPPMPLVATLFGISYLLFIAWCFRIARGLFGLWQVSQNAA